MRLGRFALALSLPLLLLGWWDAAAAQSAARGASPVLRGPLPPLPQPTVTEDEPELEDDEFERLRAAAVTEAAVAVTEAAKPALTWRVADWRAQIDSDILLLRRYQAHFARRYEAMQQEEFTIAAQHLRGVHDAVAELVRLSEFSRNEFTRMYPRDRDDELHPTVPENVRRIRVYVDRVRSLQRTSELFVSRAVQGVPPRIVRIDDDE